MGLAADFGAGVMSGLIALELGRVASLELVNPPLNLVTRELTEALARGAGPPRRPPTTSAP